MAGDKDSGLVYRHAAMTRVTHWAWAIALFFLLLSGLQIFMARPDLYICLLYTSPSPRDLSTSRMPSSA